MIPVEHEAQSCAGCAPSAIRIPTRGATADRERHHRVRPTDASSSAATLNTMNRPLNRMPDVPLHRVAHGRHEVDRDVGIERCHGGSHLWREPHRVRCTNGDAQEARSVLRQRKQKAGVARIACVAREDVRNDTHDGAPRVRGVRAAKSNPVTEGVLGREVLSRERLVDDHHRHRFRSIGRRENTTPELQKHRTCERIHPIR